MLVRANDRRRSAPCSSNIPRRLLPAGSRLFLGAPDPIRGRRPLRCRPCNCRPPARVPRVLLHKAEGITASTADPCSGPSISPVSLCLPVALDGCPRVPPLVAPYVLPPVPPHPSRRRVPSIRPFRRTGGLAPQRDEDVARRWRSAPGECYPLPLLQEPSQPLPYPMWM